MFCSTNIEVANKNGYEAEDSRLSFVLVVHCLRHTTSLSNAFILTTTAREMRYRSLIDDMTVCLIAEVTIFSRQ
jgi:hypothetical protein